MSVGDGQRVGVVVIHGVGETYEGWQDSYLIPNLEGWIARDELRTFNQHNVAHRGATDTAQAAARGDRTATANKDQPPALHLRLATLDGIDVVVVIEDEAAFERICIETGHGELLEVELFDTQELRIKHRNLIKAHFERMTVFRHADEIIQEMQELGLPATRAFSEESQVYRVRDPESSAPDKTWKSFARTWHRPDQRVAFAELYWADMSKVGNTVPSRAMALIQLFLESPFILGKAFLKRANGREIPWVHPMAWIGGLIRLSNWIMRWPIAGLNVATFITAFFMIALKLGQEFQTFSFGEWLPAAAAVGLATTALGGFFIFKRTVHKKLGLADLSLAGMIYAVILAIILGLGLIASPDNVPVNSDPFAQPETYLLFAVTLIILAWLIWTATINLAALLLSVFALKRLLVRAPPHSVPVARPAAAIALQLLLGIVWKFLLTVLGFLIISILVPGSEAGQTSCAKTMKISDFAANGADLACAMDITKTLLLAIGGLNAMALILVGIAFAVVFGLRWLGKKIFHKAAMAGNLHLPRVIASPLIIAVLFFGSFANVVALNSFAFEELERSATWTLLSGFGILVNGPTAALVALAVFSFTISRLIELSNSFIHIGRDLVDHQYNPPARSFAARLETLGLTDKDANNHEFLRYRRRLRIQRRLEALIEDVISDMEVDRLVFLAHSQGTVIMHDYLVNHDDLIERRGVEDDRLKHVQSIDILTVGSPLKHLYRYYFDDYDRTYEAAAESGQLMAKVNTWTNMYRVDDPIGQDVNLHHAIDNIGLAPGGHVNYWREAPVCEHIWRLIRGEAQRERRHAPIGKLARPQL